MCTKVSQKSNVLYTLFSLKDRCRNQQCCLKRYEVDFLSSDFKQFDENPIQAVIWRDSDFNILQQRLSELDFWLLSYIQEQPSSLEEILSALNTVVEDSPPLIPLLENTWVNWINAEVLYPKV